MATDRPTRLPPATRPGPVRFKVSDLARSEAWYREVLGLGVLEAGSGWTRLGARGEAPAPPDASPGAPDGTHLVELVELVEPPRPAPAPGRPRTGLYHAAILLPDRPSLGRFAAHLDRLRIPCGSADHRVSEALYLNDPDGLGLEVYADRPRASWQRTPSGEIAMATDPLALDDLARTAAGSSWTGMPTGTRIGHLHLHVGDLRTAEAFYADGLGFDVQVRSYPGALFMSAGGYHHHLGVNTWAREAAAVGPDDARLLSWSLEFPHLEGIEAALERVEAAGHALQRPTPGRGRIRDPWGTEVELRLAPGAPGSRA